MKTWTKIAAISAIACFTFSATPTLGEDWPNLPIDGFIKGRAARVDDIKNGDAAFVLDDHDKVIGRPINISIPQYGYSPSTGEYLIIIQAEEAPDGTRFLGARTFKGQNFVGLWGDVKLLGRKRRK